MPSREVILANNEIYHVFNKGVASVPVFVTKKDYQRALETLAYYQNLNLPARYSYFIVQSLEIRNKILEELKKQNKLLVEIIAYCLMPTHFHLILRQKYDHGISKFLGNFTNSYTRYFNTRNKRDGHLFQGKFKAVRIITDEQLLHVSRYIHLNPYISHLLKKVEDLSNYPYTSFPEYLHKNQTGICHKEIILGLFKNKRTLYRKFVYDQAEYQKKLGLIKHLISE